MGMWSDAVRHLSEPDDIDLAPDPQREDEQLCEKRWAEFVTEMRRWLRLLGIADVISELDCAYRARELPDFYGPGRCALHIGNFAHSEGWPDTLRALARAMDEQQAEIAEVERRR